MDATRSDQQRFTGEEELDDLLDHLYTVGPADFVSVRDTIAKTLRGSKRRDEAKEVSGRRRPTLAAWAVNQAVRSAPDRYGDLRQAGARLHRELRRAMSGVDRGDVGAAAQHRRAQIDGMTQLALGHLADAGHDADAHREAVTATFDAASADEHTGDSVARGELSKPLERPSEFGVLTPLAAVDDASTAQEEAAAEGDDDASEEDERRRAAVEVVNQARRRADDARSAADRAEREAASASDELEAAERQHTAAAAALERAQRQMEQATNQVEAARRKATRARTVADEAAAVAAERAAAVEEAERAQAAPAG